MRLLGVQLRYPELSDLPWAGLCGLLGATIGAGLLQVTHGAKSVPGAMTIAGISVGILVAAGANLDAGWRGVAIALAGAFVSFFMTLALL